MPRTVALLVAVAVAAGCSGGGGADEPEDAVPTTSASTTTAVEDEHDDEGGTDLTEIASQLLVTVDELGVAGLVDQGFTPGPCDDDIDAQHPPDVRVGMTASQPDTLVAVVEELRVYPSIEESAAAFDAGTFGICPLDPEETPVTDPVDVNDEVGADAANRVELIGSDDEEVVLITAVVGDAIATFVVSSRPDTPVELVPDPLDIAAFGVGKILAALEAG